MFLLSRPWTRHDVLPALRLLACELERLQMVPALPRASLCSSICKAWLHSYPFTYLF